MESLYMLPRPCHGQILLQKKEKQREEGRDGEESVEKKKENVIKCSYVYK